jgi:hypothetical protein
MKTKIALSRLWILGVALALAPACSDDGDDGGSVCERVCKKTAGIPCQGCGTNQVSNCEQDLKGACADEYRAVLECYLSASVTCVNDAVVFTTCDNQNLLLARCQNPADTCPTAFNGTCDEPGLCAAGTDTSDCDPDAG